MKGKDITMENVSRAKLEATLHDRASQYGDQITLQDWNTGLPFVETKLNQLDKNQEDKANQRLTFHKAQVAAYIPAGDSLKPPVFIVDQAYYLLWDDRCYCQTDNPDDKFPIILAKLRGQSRGSETISVSYDNPDYIDFAEYKILLEQRPSYSSLRKAYEAIHQNKVSMNFKIASRIFG